MKEKGRLHAKMLIVYRKNNLYRLDFGFLERTNTAKENVVIAVNNDDKK